MAYNLLIVDDSAVTRSVIKRAISMSGLEIGCLREAGDGAEALEVLGREWMDIVFTDLNMPRMDGFQLVDEMSASAALREIPVVVVSSNRNPAQIEALMQKGVRSYLPKPFRPEQIRQVVEELLGGSGGGSHG
jgi:two-component system chemotaxis response regulator CheY